jgi:hypothetical protein
MSAHTLTRRVMTAGERRSAELLAKRSLAPWVFMTLLFLGSAWALGMMGAKLFGPPGQLVGWALAAVAWSAMSVSFGRFDARRRARVSDDLLRGEVEELIVETDRALALQTDHSSVSPAIAIELGDGKVLLLCGPWAMDMGFYGEQTPPDEADLERTWNGLRPPHAFPARLFRLTRLASSGHVLFIEPGGEYLAPDGPIGVELSKRGPRASEIVPGSLDDVRRDPASWPVLRPDP